MVFSCNRTNMTSYGGITHIRSASAASFGNDIGVVFHSVCCL